MSLPNFRRQLIEYRKMPLLPCHRHLILKPMKVFSKASKFATYSTVFFSFLIEPLFGHRNQINPQM
jgi:hypothetical protein